MVVGFVILPVWTRLVSAFEDKVLLADSDDDRPRLKYRWLRDKLDLLGAARNRSGEERRRRRSFADFFEVVWKDVAEAGCTGRPGRHCEVDRHWMPQINR